MKIHLIGRGVLLAALAAGGLAACAPQTNSALYSSGKTMQANNVQFGTIIDVRHVETRHVQYGDRAAGIVLGGVAGGLAGNQFGGGHGKTAMTALGAVAGAAVGDSLAQQANRHLATEWFVTLDRGNTISVIQNDPSLRVGARVKVINDGSSTRLVR